jgi:hypothetical protein
MPNNEKTEDNVIGPSSKITIATASAVICCIVTVCGMFFSIKSDVAAMRNHIENDWTLGDMVVWSERLQSVNGTNVVVPEPDVTWRRLGRAQLR